MDAILETIFNDQTGDWAPISNWTQQTLVLKGQLPDIQAKMEAGGLIYTIFSFFFLFSPRLAVVIMFSLLLTESGNSRSEGEHYALFSVFFPGSVGPTSFILCQAFGRTCPAPSHTILCFEKGCLRWPINTGRLGIELSVEKVVLRHCNPPTPVSSFSLLL